MISYRILSIDPFQIDESSLGTGGVCGSIRLNEEFENLLRKKLGKNAKRILTPESLEEPMGKFDSTIKRQFNPYEADCEDEYQIRLSGNPPDIPEAGLEAGYLKVTKYCTLQVTANDRAEIQSIFVPVFDEIKRLISNQINSVKASSKAQIKVSPQGLLLIRQFFWSADWARTTT